MTDTVAPSNFDDDNDNVIDNADLQQQQQQQSSSSSSSFGGLLSSATLTRLSETEVQDLQYAFSLLDTQGTGCISVRQLMELLQELLSEQSQSQMQTTDNNSTATATTSTTTTKNDNNNNDSSSPTTTTTTSTTTCRYQHNLQRVIQQLALLPPDKDLTQADFVQLITTSQTSQQQQQQQDHDADENNNKNNNNNNNNNTLQTVFDLFSQGKSYIEVQDLQRVASELGENLSPEELQEMMQRVASAADPTKVTLQDFCHVMNRNLFP